MGAIFQTTALRSVFCFLIAGVASSLSLASAAAQQAGSASQIHAKPVHRASAAKLPRSTPSAIPDSTKNRGSAQRQELKQLENSNRRSIPGAKSHTSAATATHVAPVTGSKSQKSDIKFNYTGPKTGQAAHRNSPKVH